LREDTYDRNHRVAIVKRRVSTAKKIQYLKHRYQIDTFLKSSNMPRTVSGPGFGLLGKAHSGILGKTRRIFLTEADN
jgi:hypothetical protein